MFHKGMLGLSARFLSSSSHLLEAKLQLHSITKFIKTQTLMFQCVLRAAERQLPQAQIHDPLSWSELLCVKALMPKNKSSSDASPAMQASGH